MSKYLDAVLTEQVRDLRTGGIFQWDAKKKLVADNVFFLQVNGHGSLSFSLLQKVLVGFEVAELCHFTWGFYAWFRCLRCAMCWKRTS